MPSPMHFRLKFFLVDRIPFFFYQSHAPDRGQLHHVCCHRRRGTDKQGNQGCAKTRGAMCKERAPNSIEFQTRGTFCFLLVVVPLEDGVSEASINVVQCFKCKTSELQSARVSTHAFGDLASSFISASILVFHANAATGFSVWGNLATGEHWRLGPTTGAAAHITTNDMAMGVEAAVQTQVASHYQYGGSLSSAVVAPSGGGAVGDQSDMHNKGGASALLRSLMAAPPRAPQLINMENGDVFWERGLFSQSWICKTSEGERCWLCPLASGWAVRLTRTLECMFHSFSAQRCWPLISKLIQI